MIQFKDAHIGYGTALLQVGDISLSKGNVYALVGANGSGKTTFLNTIIGKLPILKGSITVDSISLAMLNAKKRATIIAYVNSKFDGIEFIKVREYLALGRTPYTNALGRLTASDEAAIDQAIAQVGLEAFQNRFTNELSDGERQLVAIARALVQATPVIVLDEPTAFLDYANKKKVGQLLNKIAREQQKCILFSTHDIELCQEEKFPLLLIDLNHKQLELHPTGLTKDAILKQGFNFE